MRKILVYWLVSMLSILCEAQQFIIPTGIKPTIDGVISTGEWDDADCATINVQTNWTVTVYYKHSDSALYFCYTNLVTMYGQRYPDLMLDINNDKKTDWYPDDWWLHASYNDCEGNGIYNDWTSCQPTHPGWAANNFPLNSPGTIEMEISYSKIELSNMYSDTVGISFEVSDTYTDYHYYPAGAAIGDPSTWASGILHVSSSVIEIPENNSEISVFPNPSASFINISFPNPGNEIFKLTIYNSTGQIIREIMNISGTEVRVESKHETISALKAVRGLYFFQLQGKNGKTYLGKFFLD
jgi:hypothetical protein